MHIPQPHVRRQLPGKPLPGIGGFGRLPSPLANALGRAGPPAAPIVPAAAASAVSAPAVSAPAVPALAVPAPAVSTTPVTSAASTNPCPQANGTSIGSVQQFTLLCGSVAGGDTLNTTTAASFDDCTTACASSHPKCDAVTFDGSLCTLKTGAAAAAASPGVNTKTNINSGLAQFPLASSNCASLTGPTTSTTGAISFDLFCNNVINGGDISQSNTATFQQCLDQCASTSGCGAVSFDPAYTLGFKNCYLKGTGTGEQAPIVDAGLDSAVVRLASAGGAVVSSAATGSASNGVVTVPLASLSSAVAPVATSQAGPTLETLSASAIIATATAPGLLSLSATSPFSIATATAAPQGQDSITSAPAETSRAWIAAPVVGSIAAVTVVAVMFVLWGRRRGRRSSSRMSLGSQDSLDAQRRDISRQEVAMAVTTDSVERLSIKGKSKEKEKEPLRNSMNGLAQNQTSLNGFDFGK